jgi:hypothetical protein
MHAIGAVDAGPGARQAGFDQFANEVGVHGGVRAFA